MRATLLLEGFEGASSLDGCVKFLALLRRGGVSPPDYNNLKTQYNVGRSEHSDLRHGMCLNRGGRRFHG